MTTTLLLEALAALLLPAAGWLACAWFYRRKIELLQQQLKALRQTAAEHAGQARRQIGQLQAELAARPAATRRPPVADPAPVADRAASAGRGPARDDGFAETVIGPNGFMPTQLVG
jgi:hypothetical protein